jgi:hypothetical protein
VARQGHGACCNGTGSRAGRASGIGVNGLLAPVSSDSDAGTIEVDATNDSAQVTIAPYHRLVK